MRIMSYNANGIRARIPQVVELLATFQPDILGIQETKVADEEFPLDELANSGYHLERFGQKGHYGVAFLSKQAPIQVTKGLPGDDDESQKRLIRGVWELTDGRTVTVLNGYFPQGESRDHAVKFPAKRQFYADLASYLETEHQSNQDLILMGDMNVAPLDSDIGIGADSARRWLRTGKASFLPEEREWLKRLTDWGLVDLYRQHHPEVVDRFSWFDYRSRGFEREPRRGLRIDLILATPSLAQHCTAIDIDYDFRAKPKPSDHCAVWSDFSF